MQPGRALLIAYPSGYGQNLFRSRQLMDAFTRADVPAELFVVDEEQKDTADKLVAALQQPTSFILSLNFGFGASIRGRPYSEIASAPHIIWTQQHPADHSALIATMRGTTGVIFTDGDHQRYFAKRFGHLAAFQHQCVLPFGASEIEAMDDKDIDILFVGSAPIQRSVKVNTETRDLARALEAMISHREDTGVSLMDTALHVFDIGEEVKFESKHKTLADQLAMVALIVRNRRRWALLQALVKQKACLSIAGAGWNKISYKFKGAHFLVGDRAEDMASLLSRARIVLNLDGRCDTGAHDRVLTALNAGAAVVNDYSLPHENEGSPKRRSVEDMCADILHLSTHEPARVARALEGRAWVRNHSCWDHRIGPILDLVGRFDTVAALPHKERVHG